MDSNSHLESSAIPPHETSALQELNTRVQAQQHLIEELRSNVASSRLPQSTLFPLARIIDGLFRPIYLLVSRTCLLNYSLTCLTMILNVHSSKFTRLSRLFDISRRMRYLRLMLVFLVFKPGKMQRLKAYNTKSRSFSVFLWMLLLLNSWTSSGC